MFSLLLTALGIIVFLKLNKFYQILVISLSAILPFSFGKLGPIEEFAFIEWLIPLSLAIIIFELASPLSVDRKINSINLRGAGIFIFALTILATWTIISILSHEIFPDQDIFSQSILSNSSKIGAKRIYFSIFNNIILFFVVMIYIIIYFRELDFEKYFRIILYVALALGLLRIISHFLEIDLPLIGGTFDYGGRYGKYSSIKYGGIAYRLGGLAEVASVGIPALLALTIMKGKLNILALVTLLFFIFLSGGRTIMVASIFSLVLFSVLFYPKNILYYLITGIIIVAFSLTILPDKVIKGQIGRLTSFGNIESIGEDDARAMVWKLYLENFKSEPVFGKGIEPYKSYLYTGDVQSNAFIKSQLFSGGHGSYISLLSTFGIGGLIYFLIMIFGGIVVAYRKIVEYKPLDCNKTAIGVFVFIAIIIKSIDYITGGNGLNLPILFYLTGLVSGLSVLNLSEDSTNI